ncbi:MAG: site-2 protease family protein [Marinosulfonomonas sp.]|nr:site-2 protease family protein [Marinosulfonomonas sp.]
MLYDLAFLALLIGSIFLHEMGHAWGCLVQGLPVRRIMLYGGGGFCEHARSPSRYEQELIVAMGPIVNLAIWAVASLIEPFLPNGNLAWAVYMLANINIFLAIFNLLPVHPLDGGKLFQLLLMRFMSPRTATRISGGVGVLIAVIWVPMMIFSYLYLGLVLFFIPPIALHFQMLRRAV